MIPQYVAASLVSENKVLCHPASVDSIPTSAGQEDHVSMGNAAGLKALAGARERRARRSRSSCSPGRRRSSSSRRSSPGPASRAARAFVRSLSPRLRDDRSLAGDIEAVAAAIRDGSLVAAVEARGRGARVSRGRTAASRRPYRDRGLLRDPGRARRSSSPPLTGGAVMRRSPSRSAASSRRPPGAWWRFRDSVRLGGRRNGALRERDTLDRRDGRGALRRPLARSARRAGPS